MAGHSALAKMIKMDAGVIAALREGKPLPDAKLEALHRFATIVVRERGFASDADVDAFLAAGYTRQNVLEVILGVATKVMSNYTNHIVHTQYDPFMKGNEWTKPVDANAPASLSKPAQRTVDQADATRPIAPAAGPAPAPPADAGPPLPACSCDPTAHRFRYPYV